MSFFKKIFGAIGKFFTSPQNVDAGIHAAQATLGVIGPLATSIVAFTAGAEGAQQAASVVTEIQRDLATVHGLLDSYDQAHPETVTQGITAALNGVTSSLNDLLAAGHIKNQDTQAKVSAVVTTISAEVQQIIAALPKQ